MAEAEPYRSAPSAGTSLATDQGMLDLLRYTALTYGLLLAVFSLVAVIAPARRRA